MSQKTTVVLTSDLTGEEMEPGEGETVPFALDGVSYEIDLFSDQAEELRDLLAPYKDAGRRISTRTIRGVNRQTVTTKGKYNRETLAQMRSWARQQGMSVSDRGRVPSNVIEAWEKAHDRGNAA